MSSFEVETTASNLVRALKSRKLLHVLLVGLRRCQRNAWRPSGDLRPHHPHRSYLWFSITWFEPPTDRSTANRPRALRRQAIGGIDLSLRDGRCGRCGRSHPAGFWQPRARPSNARCLTAGLQLGSCRDAPEAFVDARLPVPFPQHGPDVAWRKNLLRQLGAVSRGTSRTAAAGLDPRGRPGCGRRGSFLAPLGLSSAAVSPIRSRPLYLLSDGVLPGELEVASAKG